MFETVYVNHFKDITKEKLNPYIRNIMRENMQVKPSNLYGV